VLEGSVQRVGDSVRVSAELIDARTDAQEASRSDAVQVSRRTNGCRGSFWRRSVASLNEECRTWRFARVRNAMPVEACLTFS
jgi:hypothetical protein